MHINKIFRVLHIMIVLFWIILAIVGCRVKEVNNSDSDTNIEEEINILSESESQYKEFNKIMDDCVELINNMIKEPETIAYDDFMSEATNLLEELKKIECPNTTSDINNKLSSDKKYYVYEYIESAMAYMGSINVGDSELEEYIVNLRYDIYNKPVDDSMSEIMLNQINDIKSNVVYLVNYIDVLEGTDERLAKKNMDEYSVGKIARNISISSNLDSRFDTSILDDLYKSALSDYIVCLQSIISTSEFGNPIIMSANSMYSAKDNVHKCYDLLLIYESLIDPTTDINYNSIIYNY